MAQNPLAAFVALYGSKLVGIAANIAGTIQTSQGGLQSSLNNTANAVIKASKGRVAKVIINNPGGSSGVISINDAATSGAVAAANLVWQQAYNATANVEGEVILLDFPCQNGIYLTVDGGSPIVSVSYD